MLTTIHAASAATLIVLSSATAGALTVPFTENFASSSSGWTNSASSALDFVASGGPDASGYASSAFNFAGTNAQSTPAILRGQSGASGNEFFGNWITAPVSGLSFYFRHDASEALTVFTRWTGASSPAFPGVVSLGSPILPNTWTLVTVPISAGMPLIAEPGGTYAGIFSQVARLQVGVLPGSLAGQNVSVRFDIDQVSIVPVPGAAVVAAAGAGLLIRRRR